MSMETLEGYNLSPEIKVATDLLMKQIEMLALKEAKLQIKLEQLQQQRDDLLEACKKYGQHDHICRVMHAIDEGCCCGFTQAIASAEGSKE